MLKNLQNNHYIQRQLLIEALQNLPTPGGWFRTFPFANESNFFKSLQFLRDAVKINTSKTSLALLIGESNILSILPEIEKHVEVVILNDINQNVHAHTKFMIEGIRNAKNREDFQRNYFKSNPLRELFNDDFINESIQNRPHYTGEFYFLISEERFIACKNAAHRLRFIWTQIDCFNVEQCQLLANTLKENNAVLRIINFNNLHHYDEKHLLPSTVELLLQDANTIPAFILYSTGFDANDRINLHTRITTDHKLYLRFLKEFPRYCNKLSFNHREEPTNFKSEEIQTLIQEANQAIVLMAKNEGINDDNHIPKLDITPLCHFLNLATS